MKHKEESALQRAFKVAVSVNPVGFLVLAFVRL